MIYTLIRGFLLLSICYFLSANFALAEDAIKRLINDTISQLEADQEGFLNKYENELTKLQSEGVANDRTLFVLFRLHTAYFQLWDLENTERVAELGIPLAKQFEEPVILSKFHHSIAKKISADKRDYRAAMYHFNQALSAVPKNKYPEEHYFVISSRGASKFAYGLYDNGSEDLLAAVRYKKLNSPRSDIAFVLHDVAVAYLEIEDHENSLKYLKESLEYADENKPIFVAVTKMNIVEALINLKKFDEAETVLATACEEMLTLDDKWGLGDCELHKGMILANSNQHGEAVEYFAQASQIYEENNITSQIEESYAALARSLSYVGKHNEVNNILTKFDAKNSEEEYWLQTRKVAAVNAENWKLAYQETNKIMEQTERNRTRRSSERMEAMRISFGLVEEELKNQALQQQNDIILLEQNQKRLNYIILVFVLILVIAIAVGLLWSYMRMLKSKNKFKKIANTDVLTQCLNRRGILRQLDIQLSSFENTGQTFTIVLADFDKFKYCNDTYGHDAGDQLLICFANAFETTQRNTDLLGRLGGDEWLMIFPSAEPIHVEKCLTRIRTLFQTMASETINDEIKALFSAGIIQVTSDNWSDKDALIKLADNALYEVKKNRDESLKRT